MCWPAGCSRTALAVKSLGGLTSMKCCIRIRDCRVYLAQMSQTKEAHIERLMARARIQGHGDE
jgi:hypothetical protein